MHQPLSYISKDLELNNVEQCIVCWEEPRASPCSPNFFLICPDSIKFSQTWPNAPAVISRTSRSHFLPHRFPQVPKDTFKTLQSPLVLPRTSASQVMLRFLKIWKIPSVFSVLLGSFLVPQHLLPQGTPFLDTGRFTQVSNPVGNKISSLSPRGITAEASCCPENAEEKLSLFLGASLVPGLWEGKG